MLQSMQNRLDEIQARYFEIEKLMSQNDIASDPNSIRKLGREYSQLQTIVDLWSDINQNEKNLNETKEIIKEETDPDVIEMAREEAQLLEEKILLSTEKIKLELLPKDDADLADAVIEIRAGAGGDEAGLFASDIFRMYQRYSELKSWKLKILSQNDTGVGGIKEVTFEISGEKVYQRLHLESGVHRVQRVPSTESQ